ncbi:MAG: flagellar hook-length control protein FliK [Alphaproteobacteria bacterium]|nr:flagellar hook-length control protein FliK [Alphaproteobacteria bacterium]
MNVKEVNNPLARFLLGKNGAQSQNAGETAQAPAFASLVAGASLSPDALIGSDVRSFDARPSAAADASLKAPVKEREKTPVREDRPARGEDNAVERNDRPVKEEERQDKETPEAAAIEASQRDERPAPRAEAGTAPSAEIQPRSDAEPVTREMNLQNAAQAPVAAVMNGTEVVLLPQNADLSGLASLAEVSVLDQASGQIVTMSGAELAAKLQQASESGRLFVAGAQIAENMVELIPAEFSGTVENRFGTSDIKAAAPLAGEAEAPVVDEALAEQAQILDAKLDGRKAKIDVEVREEKFSHSDTGSLIKGAAVVDEAVKSVVKDKSVVSDGKNQAAGLLQNAQSRQNTAPVQANMPAAAGAAMPTAADAQVSVEAAKSVSAETVSSLNAAHSALNGAAASLPLKAGAGVKAEDTSFRDVYKGMSREAVEQVKVNITKSAVKGVDKIDIQLKPEDLGHVQIKMQISKDGKLQAEIIASRQDTLEILQKEADSLQKAFSDAGFDTDGGSFSFSFRGEEEQNRDAELRNFIGSVLEQESNEELVSNDNLTWDPAQGLNIRV